MRLEHLLSGGFGDIVDIVIFSGDVFPVFPVLSLSVIGFIGYNGGNK